MIAWRINGLISAIQYQIADANETIASSLNQEETKALNIVLDWIEHEMSISKTAESCNRLKIGLNEGIIQYLLEFEKSRRQFAGNLGLEATDEPKNGATDDPAPIRSSLDLTDCFSLKQLQPSSNLSFNLRITFGLQSPSQQ